MDMLLSYLSVFFTGGVICAIGQILIDKTKKLHFETEKRLFEVDVVATGEKYNFCFKMKNNC